MSSDQVTVIHEKNSQNNLVAVILAVGAVLGLNLLNPLVWLFLIGAMPLFFIAFVLVGIALVTLVGMVGHFVGTHITAVLIGVVAVAAAMICRSGIKALVNHKALEDRISGLERELAASRGSAP